MARAELFISDTTLINIRFRDLRATAVTWMTVRGDNPALVMNRVGHEDSETMKRCAVTRAHRADGAGQPLRRAARGS